MPNTHPFFYSVEITEEANFTDGPDCIDGAYPNVRQALIEGVVEARQTLQRLGHPDVKVGFNSTPTFGPSVEFWRSLGSLGGQRFLDALDYVGLDFFPDVFRPAAPDGETGDVRESALAEATRREWLPEAGIGPHVPIHIAENGWPTGPTRSFERQSRVLETMIRAIYEDIFYHFGLTRDDYSPKPAYETFRGLIQEFGTR
jgi:hypothetical protein